MFFQRRQDIEISLHSSCIVEADDIAFAYLDEILLIGKASAIIPFLLQDSPELLHKVAISISFVVLS